MSRTHLVLASLLWAAVTAGCATSRPVGPLTEAVPGDLALTLYRGTGDGRYTYFELAPNGEMAYAGGRAARFRDPRPILTLDRAQRRIVWDTIRRHDLLRILPSPTEEPEDDATQWELDLQGAGYHNRVKVTRDDAEGLAALHERLFAYQAAQRYNAPYMSAPAEPSAAE